MAALGDKICPRASINVEIISSIGESFGARRIRSVDATKQATRYGFSQGETRQVTSKDWPVTSNGKSHCNLIDMLTVDDALI